MKIGFNCSSFDLFHAGANGTPNLGAGGGGGSGSQSPYTANAGGNGGDGIVIIAYPTTS